MFLFGNIESAIYLKILWTIYGAYYTEEHILRAINIFRHIGGDPFIYYSCQVQLCFQNAYILAYKACSRRSLFAERFVLLSMETFKPKWNRWRNIKFYVEKQSSL